MLISILVIFPPLNLHLHIFFESYKKKEEKMLDMKKTLKLKVLNYTLSLNGLYSYKHTSI